MSAQSTSPSTPKATHDVTAPTDMQYAGVYTRGMTKRSAINEAAASLRAAKVPTQQRTFTAASICAAAAAIIASSSPQHRGQAIARTSSTPSPKTMGATVKKAEISDPCTVSAMTLGAETMEEQMRAMMEKIERVMKDNEEKNKKIEELQREVAALGKQKVGEVSHAVEDVEDVEDKEDDSHEIIPTSIVNNDQLQLMIANAVKRQISGNLSGGPHYVKPYTRRVNILPMPQGYQPPKFQLFDGQGNPRQHIAHFVETCNNAGTDGDQLVKQFVRSLKGIAFDWYTDLEPESIDSWNQMEEEFLNRFYCTRRIVSMSELTSTKQWEDEPVVEYISRWRSLSLQCKDRISETSAVEMCIDGMNWELLYILKGIKPRNFQELVTRAHDMEITVKGHERSYTSSSKTFVERKESKRIDDSPKEAMNISSSARVTNDKQKDVVRKDSWNNKPTLKELQAKKYPFPDADLSGMLDSLLENNIIQLPEPKRPEDVNKVNNPKYCRYHRMVSHSIEDCMTLKELIMRLVNDGTIEIGEDEVATHYIAIEEVGKGERDACSEIVAPRNRGHRSRKRSKLHRDSVSNRLGAALKVRNHKRSLKRSITASHKTGSKFKSKWNGPYMVQEVYTNGAHRIVGQDGFHSCPNNGKSLKCYYT